MTTVAGREDSEPARRPSAPSRREVLNGLSEELSAAGIESGRHEAERLLAHVLGLSRSELLLQIDRVVEPDDAGRIATASQRRLSGVPLQHIEGTVAFRELVLACDGRTLIPRPETEQLVQQVVDWAQRAGSSGSVRVVRRSGAVPPVAIALDIGTGSGAIALSLLQEGIAERAVAVDVSADALEQAAQNAAVLGLEGRIEWRQAKASPWEVVGPGEKYGVIVSNPPYIAESDLDALPIEVRDHDPREALSGGSDGLAVIRQIVTGARTRIASPGGLFLEVGAGQGEAVRGLLEQAAEWSTVMVASDHAGHARFVVALT